MGVEKPKEEDLLRGARLSVSVEVGLTGEMKQAEANDDQRPDEGIIPQ